MSDKYFEVRVLGKAENGDFVTFGGWTQKEARACVEKNIAEDRASFGWDFAIPSSRWMATTKTPHVIRKENKMVEHRLVQRYLQVLRENTLRSLEARGFHMAPPIYEARSGLKYTKIVVRHGAGSNFQESVHSFVDANGNVYKAASWRAPAAGVRYRLEQDMELLKHIVDPYGGYLYKGAR